MTDRRTYAYEKVNPSHPDKIADRIAGALVDLAYSKAENPRIAVEVLDSGDTCTIVIETNADITNMEAIGIARRISRDSTTIQVQIRPQDPHLAENQEGEIRCGDNGIFKGTPITEAQQWLADFVGWEYSCNQTDGKAYIVDRVHDYDDVHFHDYDVVHCQSKDHRTGMINGIRYNPLGYWTGGPDVDTGATNRKLGSDLGDAVTGGGIHGKDLSKADVTVNIALHLLAQETGHTWEATCSIGDTEVVMKDMETLEERTESYSDLVETARKYITSIGGFERFAEWGLIRPKDDD